MQPEVRTQERYERGVYAPSYTLAGRRPWVYAVNSRGEMTAWLEYGEGVGRTIEQASARLWRHLDTHDPLRPQLRLVTSESMSDDPLDDPGLGSVVLFAVKTGWPILPPPPAD